MRIAILGAGIGGLTMAQALKKSGKAFDLFEASSMIKPVGAGIWVPPNAMQVMKSLDKSQDILDRGLPLSSMSLLDSKMGDIQLIDGSQLSKAYQFPTVSIKRHTLHSLLNEDLPEASVHLGHQCEGIKRKGSKTSLFFKNGFESEYDLVIAADGIHSIARRAMGDLRPLRYSGQTCFRAITKMDIPNEYKNRSLEIWGQGARFGCSPVGDKEVYWYAPFTAPAHNIIKTEERKSLLKQKYLQFPEWVQKILDASLSEDIIQTDLFELTPSHSWGQEGLLLLGDAAHSMTPNLGQGAAMAIEDAYTLMKILDRTSDQASIVKLYNQERVQRVNKIADWARQLGSLGGWENPLACELRNALLRHTPRRITNKQVDFIYTSPALRSANLQSMDKPH